MPASQSRLVTESLMKKYVPPGTPPMTDDQIAQSRGIQGDLPGQEFLDQQQSVISQQLAGEIPQDVQDQVERISAEKSIQSGLGQGQAARNLTARDLGLTSLDIQERGLKNAAQVSSIQGQYNALEEQMREWDDKHLEAIGALRFEGVKYKLAAAELISRNQIETMKLVNQLLIQDSEHAIATLEDNVNTLIGTPDGSSPGLLYDDNEVIRELLSNL